jgi:hypothetical protein
MLGKRKLDQIYVCMYKGGPKTSPSTATFKAGSDARIIKETRLDVRKRKESESDVRKKGNWIRY